MVAEVQGVTDPRMLDAIEEIENLVLARYPDATFDVFPSTNVNGIYMRIYVDVDDPGDVNLAILDRVVELQLDEGLPIYPVAIRPRTWSVVRPDASDQDRVSTAVPNGVHDAAE